MVLDECVKVFSKMTLRLFLKDTQTHLCRAITERYPEDVEMTSYQSVYMSVDLRRDL